MKKKILALLLSTVVLTLAACGAQKDPSSESEAIQENIESAEDSSAGNTEESVEEGNEENSEAIDATKETSEDETSEAEEQTKSTALTLINEIWASYGEDEKFAVGGGDSENLNFEGPGAFDVAKTEELEATLAFPVAHVDKIDGAASMINAMMANNFTTGVYHMTDSENYQELADAVKTNILGRQWLCGMPEQFVVMIVEDHMIAAFGLTDAINTFRDKVTDSYEAAVVLHEGAVNQ